MTTAPHSPLVQRVARGMVLASTGTKDPDKLVPAPRGQIGMAPLWKSYVHLAQAALEASRAEELLDALRLILPLAKGYAAIHPVDATARLVERADDLLAKLEGRV